MSIVSNILECIEQNTERTASSFLGGHGTTFRLFILYDYRDKDNQTPGVSSQASKGSVKLSDCSSKKN